MDREQRHVARQRESHARHAMMGRSMFVLPARFFSLSRCRQMGKNGKRCWDQARYVRSSRAESLQKHTAVVCTKRVHFTVCVLYRQYHQADYYKKKTSLISYIKPLKYACRLLIANLAHRTVLHAFDNIIAVFHTST